MPNGRSSPLYKYNYLITGLRKKIFDNEFGSKGRLPAERALSEMYDVSRVTVRTALKQLKEESLIEQQQGRGTFVKKMLKDKGPKATEKSIKEHFNVGFIIRNNVDIIDSDPYFGQILLGFYRAHSEQFDYNIKNINIGKEGKLNEYFSHNNDSLNKLDGLVIACSLNDSDLDYLERHDIKFVLLGQAESYRSVSTVDIDNFKGIYDATDHLLEKGYRKILFMYSYYNTPNREQRLSGFRCALSKYNIEPDSKLLYEIDGRKTENAEELLSDLLKKGIKFDSVLVIGDWATLGVFNILKSRKIKIPDEIGVVCFDAYSWTLEGISPRPTAIVQPFAKIGEKALDILSKLKEEKEGVTPQAIIRPYLIQGKST